MICLLEELLTCEFSARDGILIDFKTQNRTTVGRAGLGSARARSVWRSLALWLTHL